MPSARVNKGRHAEGAIALKLTRWAAPYYRFRRLGLGHKGVADLVADRLQPELPEWLHGISVKSAQGPTLPAMLRAFNRGQPWPWWQELVRHEVAAYAWLVWKSEATWLLSYWDHPRLDELGVHGVAVCFAPYSIGDVVPRGWPRYITRLDCFLSAVPIAAVVESLRR